VETFAEIVKHISSDLKCRLFMLISTPLQRPSEGSETLEGRKLVQERNSTPLL
jgi:hypothetical protein